jgi:hypothetical protein
MELGGGEVEKVWRVDGRKGKSSEKKTRMKMQGVVVAVLYKGRRGLSNLIAVSSAASS